MVAHSRNDFIMVTKRTITARNKKPKKKIRGNKKGTGSNNNKKNITRKPSKKVQKILENIKIKRQVKPPKNAIQAPRDIPQVPPTHLFPTGSKNVYISTEAMAQHKFDPKKLFTNQKVPPTFAKGNFKYISPKQFGYKPPNLPIPEVAFLGRSNVGKSSLINALMTQKLARCSKQPGRTQQVNYFGLLPSNLPFHVRDQPDELPKFAMGFLIDLPGYGYAKAPNNAVQKWQETTQDFLLQRSKEEAQMFRKLFILVDARRGPSQIDRDVMSWFDEANIHYTVVVTKADRVGRPEIIKIINEICMRHHSQIHGAFKGNQGPLVHITSASTGEGILELMASVDAEFVGYHVGDTLDSNDLEDESDETEDEYNETEDEYDETEDDDEEEDEEQDHQQVVVEK